jgi:hypothetical protein
MLLPTLPMPNANMTPGSVDRFCGKCLSLNWSISTRSHFLHLVVDVEATQDGVKWSIFNVVLSPVVAKVGISAVILLICSPHKGMKR